MFRRLIIVLGILLCASCSNKENPGTPYILYEIHGTVVDQDGQPLKDIKVTSGTTDPVYTSVNGLFVLFGKTSPTASQSVLVSFEDVDNENNGGTFQKASHYVDLNFRSAGNGNNKGNYFASNVLVKMIPKNQGMQGGEDTPVPIGLSF